MPIRSFIASLVICAGLQAPACLAQTVRPGDGRAVTTSDFLGGGYSSDFSTSKLNGDGSREVTQHFDIQPMAFYPAIVVSVTGLTLDTKPGHVGYSIEVGEPICNRPSSKTDMECVGFDLTIREDADTKISQIQLSWFVMNVVNPALVLRR